jgi:hypothetical protein
MKTKKLKIKNKLCTPVMTFQQCELAILRNAVDEIGLKEQIELVNSEEVKNIILVVEEFLVKEKLICYGGTAINNLLPDQDKFYDKEVEIPDYDFYSYDAMKHAKKLADIYHKKGFTDIEAKAGVHFGTYKVFVNFIPVADITQIPEELFKSINKEAVTVAGIRYCPPNFLRMAMYLELSRPRGDVSRWEKVLKRLILLNKHYPLMGDNCKLEDIQRELNVDLDIITENEEETIYNTLLNSFIDQGLVFFGSMANSMYMKYYDSGYEYKRIPDFDVLSENPELSATIIKELLEEEGLKKVKIRKQEGVGEIIAPHWEIIVKGETLAFIYKPIACHSYNVIKLNNKKVHIATIDTMLSFYLAFLYADRSYYDKNRIVCMAEYLFKVQEKNRLSQRAILKRFSMDCIGKQPNIFDIRIEKSNKFKELRFKRGTKEYDRWFLKYNPDDKEIYKEVKKRKTEKNRNTGKSKTRKTFKTLKTKNLFDIIKNKI